jgi:hypothetical protein
MHKYPPEEIFAHAEEGMRKHGRRFYRQPA